MSTVLPELLAPAGNLHCALTAFEHGADAVYAGMSRFNAREMGDNFSWTDMARLSTRAKQTGKKIYITLNTLVKESEWTDFCETTDRIAGLEPEGIIVQDLGVAAFLRDRYPELEIHASTQMGFHNTAGLETAARLGIRRVILERQVTMDELKAMAAGKPPVDLEVFIHGALCCSLSGQCLFSSWIGGWSGNRGKCKQPCRRRYYSERKGEKSAGFYFSTQDLYCLDLISDYIDLGISSLKIEGRLRKPDYIASTVRAYRMVLDSGGRDVGVIKEARGVLTRSFGRKWSHGFATPGDMNDLIQYDSIGVSGQLVGRVSSVRGDHLDVRLNRPLHAGDRVRVQPDSGDEGPAFTVDDIILEGRSTRRAGKGDTVTLRYAGELPRGGNLYRIGVYTTPPSVSIESIVPFQPRRPLDVNVSVSRSGITIGVENLEGSPAFSRELSLDGAEKHPLSSGALREAFRHTRNDTFRIRSLTTEIRNNPFLPASMLKELRREFRTWLEDRIGEAGAYNPGVLPPEPPKERASTVARDLRASCRISGSDDRGCRKDSYRVSSVFAFGPGTDEVILPPFCAEGDTAGLKKQIEKAYRAGIRRFRLTSLYQLRLVQKYKDLMLSSSYPLPATNARAMEELASLGFTRVQGWLELGKEDLEALRKLCPVNFEIYRYGRPPLLVTRAAVAAEGRIHDARGKSFFVEHDSASRLTSVYPREIMEIPSMKGAAEYSDMRRIKRGDTETTDFNYTRGLV